MGNGTPKGPKHTPSSGSRVFEARDAEGRFYGKQVRTESNEGKDFKWTEHEGSGLSTKEFPFYGSEQIAEYDPDEPVILVEGPKTRDALYEAGVFAVLGTFGTSHLPADQFFEPLRGKEVIGWADGDDPGRKHMNRLLEKTHKYAAVVRDYTWYEAPTDIDGPDAADHPAVQSRDKKKLDRLLNDLLGAPKWEPQEQKGKPRTMRAAELMDLELPPVKWAVPELVPEGVTLLVGKPKLGKSWMALGLCWAVASGGYALGKVPVQKGSTLYLALEDNTRRLKTRLAKVLNGSSAPESFEVATEWPRMGEGCIDALDEWLSDHPDARLVVIDTLAKVKPASSGRRNAYDEDRATTDPFAPLIEKHGVAIILVHHLRKMAASDPLDEINASTGLMASVDGTLILKRERGRADAFLYCTGREIENESEQALKWDQELASWTLAGDAEEFRMSIERQKIIDLLRRADEPLGPKDISEALDQPYGSVRVLLPDMVREGLLSNPKRGKYALVDINNVNNVNNDNTTNSVNNGSFDFVGDGSFGDVNDTLESVINNGSAENPIGITNSLNVNDVNDVDEQLRCAGWRPDSKLGGRMWANPSTGETSDYDRLVEERMRELEDDPD